MIPKKIHYCWFGGSELPPLAKECVNSWKKNLPDYELIRWDEKNAPINAFVRHHLRKGNWAFVSDYVRLYVLYNHGGVYLDTDVEVIKTLDSLLDNTGFVAYEDKVHITNGVAGSVKGNEFFNECMKYMLKRYDNNENYHVSPIVTTNVLKAADYEIKIFDSHYFYPYNPYDISKEIKIFMYEMIKEDTYAIHHWAKSWTLEEPVKSHSGTGICTLLNKLCSRISNKLRKFF